MATTAAPTTTGGAILAIKLGKFKSEKTKGQKKDKRKDKRGRESNPRLLG